LGFIEGRNVEFEFRFADGEYSRLPGLAADLVRWQPAIITALTTIGTVAAAEAADGKIPIVFNVGSDPVRLGFVASFSRPGGNMTGTYSFADELIGKMLDLLHNLMPRATTIAMLQAAAPDLLLNGRLIRGREAAAALGLQLLEFTAGTDREIEAVFATAVQQHADALLIPTSPYFISRAQSIVGMAARHGLPVMYGRRDYSEAGGLISYGNNVTESYRQIGIYAGRILKGEKPADLPIVQPIKLELVINVNTARNLGIEIPPNLLAIADEVIE
jgi:putative ABC transport system substrate-binding protein